MPAPNDPIELAAPDIERHRTGNTGIPFVHSFQGAQPGPHVVLNALMHGNELCGAIALDRFLSEGLRPRRGRLSLCFANVEAFKRFDPVNPTASRFVDEDMNRIWGLLNSRSNNRELRRAREMWPVFAEADYLLDIHSMQYTTAPLMLCGRAQRGRDLALRLGCPGWVVADAGHDAGLRLIDHDRFTGRRGTATALLAECGQHWRADSAGVAVESCLRFLLLTGILDAEDVPPNCRTPLPPARLVEVTEAVTARTGGFTFADAFKGMEIVPDQGTVIAHDGPHAIRTPYPDCILIMPTHRLRPGQTAVRLGRVLQ